MTSFHKKTLPTPYDEAGFFSKLFYCWVTPIFKKAITRQINENEIFDISSYETAKFLTEKLQKEWSKELEKEEPSLIKAYIRYFWKQYLRIGILALLENIFTLVQSILIWKILESAENPKQNIGFLMLYGSCYVVSVFLVIIVRNPYFFFALRYGMHMKTGISGLIYAKILRLNQKSLGQTTTGQIINLLSNDVNKFELSLPFLHYVWIGPIVTVVSILLLYKFSREGGLAAIILFIVLIPLQLMLGKLFSSVRQHMAVISDERIKMVSELLNGMKVVKMYCWQPMFVKVISKIRIRYLRLGIYRKSIKCFLVVLRFSGNRLMILVLLIVMTKLNKMHLFKSDSLWFVIIVINYLRRNLVDRFSLGVTHCCDLLVSTDRIQKLLLLPEFSENEGGVVIRGPLLKNLDGAPVPAIYFKNVSATWHPLAGSNKSLNNLSFKLEKGQICAIIGQFGAGKSSLLMAILGELPISEGEIMIHGSVSYVSQQPWVFSGTIKSNILFYNPNESEQIEDIINSTTLKQDIQAMPLGLHTRVGERGGTLSGGQKARVALSRTVYENCDIILMDDPLAAVDASVITRIFSQCLLGRLRGKLILLVTHQEHLLAMVDNILVLHQGSLLAFGSLNDIMSKGYNLADLVEKNDEKEGMKLEDIIITESNQNNVGSKGFAHPVDEAASLVTPYANITHNRRNDIEESNDDMTSDSAEFSKMHSNDLVTPSIETFSEAEKVVIGSVGMGQYWYYFTVGACWCFLLIMLIIYIATMLSYVFCDIWVSFWAADMDKRNQSMHNFYQDDWTYLLGFIIATIVTFVLGFISVFSLFLYSCFASYRLHNAMLTSILNAPMEFFDSTPTGRILNRFSKDIGIADDILPVTTQDCILTSFLALASLGVAIYKNYWSIIVIVPLLIIVWFLRASFQNVARSVKRIEAITRSPVFTHVSSTLQGLTIIRTSKKQDVFIETFQRYIDRNSRPFMLYIVTSRWFAMRLDEICFVFIGVVTYSCILLLYFEQIKPSDFGLILTYISGLIGLAQWAIRQSTEMENQMISVERIREYTNLPAEQPAELPSDKQLENWPLTGTIEFKNVSLSYVKDGPQILKNVSLKIEDKQKIGIVGRTGAGKSSLTAVLFRLVELDPDNGGKVFLDNVNIANMGIFRLRQSLSAIPQDPILFQGSLRLNLDPFDQHQDSKLWSVLQTVNLKDMVENLSNGLDSPVSEGGSNLSVGTRQLICLARALLRDSRVLLIDEATANVDQHTDKMIQHTLREAFSNCTVLTIAHRLNTIMDCDRIIVMSSGSIAQFGHPHELLQDENTKLNIFAQLVHEAGAEQEAHLKQVAEANYSRKH